MKDSQEKLSLLDDWEIRMKAVNAHFDRVKNILGLEPECKTLSLVDELQTEYTKAVAEKVGDNGEWLLWYWLENSMGEDGLEAVFKDKSYLPVFSVVDLLACIEKDCP